MQVDPISYHTADLVISRSFLLELLGSLVYNIMSSANMDRFSPYRTALAVGFSPVSFIVLRNVLCSPTLWNFHYEGMMEFDKSFFCIY